MALEIDKRLLDPSSQMEIIENLNRILKLVDSASGGAASGLETIKKDIQNLKTATADLPKLKSDLAALTERVATLEGTGA